MAEHIVERFWKYTSRAGEDECWLWKGFRDKDGYGALTLMRKCGKWAWRPVRAHRISWEIHAGPIPSGMCVLHHCDVRECVNPKHLYVGTNRDNQDDVIARNRRKGERQSNHKLTNADVAWLRSVEPTWANARIMAVKLRITPENASMVMLRKTWKHLP